MNVFTNTNTVFVQTKQENYTQIRYPQINCLPGLCGFSSVIEILGATIQKVVVCVPITP